MTADFTARIAEEVSLAIHQRLSYLGIAEHLVASGVVADPAEVTALNAQLTEMWEQRSKAEAVLHDIAALHTPWSLYGECGHVHTDDEVDAGTVKVIHDVGYVCEDGLRYQVCAECCTEGDREYQTEECAVSHIHGKDLPICDTTEILARNGFDREASNV